MRLETRVGAYRADIVRKRIPERRTRGTKAAGPEYGIKAWN